MKSTLLILLILTTISFGQTTLNVYPDSLESNVGLKYTPGVFYVPKTAEAQADFLGNGIHQNAIRTHIIESALNNTTNLIDCIAFLDGVSTILQDLSNKTEKLVFIFEKMPAWLSSSTDGSPAQTPGWYVLNTKPPANYADWNNMVTTITNRIVNTYGINNAYFEIWNEPDLGSWTGTQAEFFELYQHTYDAIKSGSAANPVGGPATNHWAKNISYQQPYGYINNSIGDLSLIGELLDSTAAWNKPLDFVSWHNFHIQHETNKNAIAYIAQKCASLGVSTPELMVSEWNTPSQVRETPLQRSYFIKSQIETAKTSLESNMVAAWQDFEQSTNEFHNDYGMLSYGSIHKPAYKVMLLSNKLNGSILATNSSIQSDRVATLSSDTLSVLITNYAPPAFIGAFDYLFFEHQLNSDQLDAAGYIDMSTGNVTHLDSIFQGLITISSTDAISTAINNSIPIYTHYQSIETSDRDFIITIPGISGTHSGLSYVVDSKENNTHFTYDSLLVQGLTQNDAIANITADQSLESSAITLNNGQISFSMEPNSVRLFQFIIPELVSINELEKEILLDVYPNPVSKELAVKSDQPIGKVQLLSVTGEKLNQVEVDETNYSTDMSTFPSGIYYLHFVDLNKTVKVVHL
ncbi:MAG: T9SS type A sorting domain-containing protein [Flavobacteriales bacterium]|nr:T9SS type A sorting domain-containing protein [Flavobacteriales bacterium]